MERRNQRKCLGIFCDSLHHSVFLGILALMAYDYEYWLDAPSPFYIFIISQGLFYFLLFKIPNTQCFSKKCQEISIVILIISIIVNTIVGSIWFNKIYKDDNSFLKTYYIYIASVQLGIPIAFGAFVFVIFIVVMYFLFVEHRRLRQRQRLEDEGLYDQEYYQEVADTYMKMLEIVPYEKSKVKANDCAICLKEFAEGEELSKIPNCGHVFHGECLRKWFFQLQICPMCRGNIIKMPNSQRMSADDQNYEDNLHLPMQNQNEYGLNNANEDIVVMQREHRQQTHSVSDYGDFRGQSPRQAFNMLSSQQNQISSNGALVNVENQLYQQDIKDEEEKKEEQLQIIEEDRSLQ